MNHYYYDDLLLFSSYRRLQTIPNYTSPPLERALAATPEEYRSDDFVNAARASAANETCNKQNNRCQIVFGPPTDNNKFDRFSPLGVIFYGGALVDPRSYSPLGAVLANRYGLPTVIPIFDRDLAFNPFDPNYCSSGRVALAQAEFPSVEHWIFAGHSLGGIAAMADVWTLLPSSDESDIIGGLTMLGATARQLESCGAIDFSDSDLPMAYLVGSLDGHVNFTNWESSKALLSNHTFSVNIFGGNHAYFGSYNYTERTTILGPEAKDGVAIISEVAQQDISTAAIYHVATRSGLTLPQPIHGTDEKPSPTSEPTSNAFYGTNSPLLISWILLAFTLWLWCKF